MTAICPDIPSHAIYPIGKTAELLGMSRSRLLYYCELGARQGGISYTIPKGETRKKFKGADIIAFWKRKQGM